MIEKLACMPSPERRGRRNEEAPNIELAEELCRREDAEGIEEIVEGLTDTDKAVANDCIKVLYEIGVRKPELVSEYAEEFLTLLQPRNNRLVCGLRVDVSFVGACRHSGACSGGYI